MYDAHNDDFAVGGEIVDCIVATKMGTQARCEVVPRRTEKRLGQQGRKAFLELFDEPRCVLRGVLRDERPNLGEVIFGLFGYSEDSGLANRLRPL